jgi:hypothetical protein
MFRQNIGTVPKVIELFGFAYCAGGANTHLLRATKIHRSFSRLERELFLLDIDCDVGHRSFDAGHPEVGPSECPNAERKRKADSSPSSLSHGSNKIIGHKSRRQVHHPYARRDKQRRPSVIR